eukprot:TRINITY_DN21347_c0_g1_i1.p1 TRINITY_DN21347_c0_g1~~TRINITY_DN21347_c0_g1_i1.p1  ORF type:complete len:208 (+),score=56.64 TRINITY_DN21347_c0_g1_i1:218-841(+)
MVHAEPAVDWRAETPEQLFGMEPPPQPGPSRLHRMVSCLQRCWPKPAGRNYTNQELDNSLLSQHDRLDLDHVAMESVAPMDIGDLGGQDYTPFTEEHPTPAYQKLTEREEKILRGEQPIMSPNGSWRDPDQDTTPEWCRVYLEEEDDDNECSRERAMSFNEVELSPTGARRVARAKQLLSLIHISEPTRLLSISYAVFCLKKKKNQK